MASQSNSIPVIRVIIPALNEEDALPRVLKAIPAGISEVIVVDNGSTDGTVSAAKAAGATVVHEPRRGYGAACLRGLEILTSRPDTGIVVFLDGDYSDHPEEMLRVVEPILADKADLVIGSRVLGNRENGALLPVARFGNWLSTTLIAWGWDYRYTDLGPFRAIRYESLVQLDMRDRDFGWTVEMQTKALSRGLRVTEVPVSYRKRIGTSKISGTFLGSYRAGRKILLTIGREWFRRPKDKND